MGRMKVKLNGVEHDINDDGYTWLESPGSILLVHASTPPGQSLPDQFRAVGGAYWNTGGGGRWIVAKFGNPHVFAIAIGAPLIVQAADVRSWVITERQLSVSAYTNKQVRHELGKLCSLEKWFVEGKSAPPATILPPPTPEAHDVTYSEALWDI